MNTQDLWSQFPVFCMVALAIVTNFGLRGALPFWVKLLILGESAALIPLLGFTHYKLKEYLE